VDLDRRVHRNQDNNALGRMAFVILKTFFSRIEKLGEIELRNALYKEMIQYKRLQDRYQPEIYHIEGHERPPMITIDEYRAKFKKEIGNQTGKA